MDHTARNFHAHGGNEWVVGGKLTFLPGATVEGAEGLFDLPPGGGASLPYIAESEAATVAARPIHQQMKANASKDPKIITGVLSRSIRIGPVKKRRRSGKSITIGVHRKEEGAYYATPVEYGHGGPAPAPAHPFIRPAYDTRADEAYQIIRDGLRDAIDRL